MRARAVLIILLAILVGCSADRKSRNDASPGLQLHTPAAPVGLLLNGVNTPLATDREMARFTWQSPNRSRGEMQTAYQILVSSSAQNLASGVGEWWDSGKVVSNRSASVEYA